MYTLYKLMILQSTS